MPGRNAMGKARQTAAGIDRRHPQPPVERVKEIVTLNAPVARMVDANVNRASEGLRLLEDYARFVLGNENDCAMVKQDRHSLRAMRIALLGPLATTCRDTPGDVGTGVKTDSEFKRTGMAAVLEAAGARATEALRVLEEIAKLKNSVAAAQLEAIRYRTYTLTHRLVMGENQRGRFGPAALCVLLTESICHLPWKHAVEDILKSGPRAKNICIQLREKQLSDSELLIRAKWLNAACRTAGATCIINDRLDIAMAAQAGVHLGQQDLPCATARKIAGVEMLIGVSTGTLAEARLAIADGASYIGIGAMFSSSTKAKPSIAGPALAAEISAVGLPIPAFAIGGIRLDNLPQLLSAGISRIAVSGAIIATDRPGEMCDQFLNLLADQALSEPGIMI